MKSEHVRTRPKRRHILRAWVRCSVVLLIPLHLSACLPHIDLAPDYQPAKFVVPASWHGASPFVKANPSDGELRQDWWKLYEDPILNKLVEQAMAANPDLQAAAERFVQARDVMMQVRSRRIPNIGLGFDASDNRQSDNRLFRGIGEANQEATISAGGLASWEPDFWSAIRNATRLETYRAEERGADYGLARLSLQAEVSDNYFTLRGLDAQVAIYDRSINLYRHSLDIVKAQFAGAIASALDVARVESLLYSTETKLAQVQGQRQVTEQAIAILVNRAPASFTIKPIKDLHMVHFTIPPTFPSTLLERRPDVAAMERQMAQANRAIGIARAAFFPEVVFRADGGFEDGSFSLIKLASSFWSYGSTVALPLFQGGYRRAQLQQSWSIYRETEDRYRSAVLNAFREVESALTLTNQLSIAAKRQDAAVGANLTTQNLTSDLYQGGLASSLELIFSQVQTLEASIESVAIKADLLKATVALIRAMGGGWNRKHLPADEDIQPFDTFQYVDLDKPLPAGGIDVNASNSEENHDLTKPSVP